MSSARRQTVGDSSSLAGEDRHSLGKATSSPMARKLQHEAPTGFPALWSSRSLLVLITLGCLGASLSFEVLKPSTRSIAQLIKGISLHALRSSNADASFIRRMGKHGEPTVTSDNQQVELEFVSYRSSPMERFFLQKLPEMNFPDQGIVPQTTTGASNISSYLEDYCSFVASYSNEIQTWLAKVEESRSTGKMYFDDNSALEVFSVYEFRYACPQEPSGFCAHKTMIEPLAFFLRHPLALCVHSFPEKYSGKEFPVLAGAMDHSYLLTATSEQTKLGPQEHLAVDLGALYRGGEHPYPLLKNYEDAGVKFDRMIMWEAEQVTGETIFKMVPKRWYHAFQFFNVPVTTDVTSDAHPLQIVKKAHPGSGFIAFKLDIDHNEIENTVAEKLIEWHDQFPSINAGQFEFFFEQHVDFKPMRRWWAKTATESGKTLGDSYELYLKMRKLGIRAHGWV